MDNLFTSLRFTYYAHTLTQCHLTGLCRAQRGIPACVWQRAEKTDAAIARVKDTFKSASLVNGTFGVLATSLYDKKPVHIMSTCTTIWFSH